MNREFERSELDPEEYKAWLRNKDEIIEAQVRKEVEARRARVREHARQIWLDLGGSEEDWAAITAEETEGSYTSAEGRSNRGKRRSRGMADSTGSRVSRPVVHRYTDSVLEDPNVEFVTQTEIKSRILQDYPNSKVHSLRSAIYMRLNELIDEGRLELLETGKAGSPSKYVRKQPDNEETQTEPRNSGSEVEPSVLNF